MSRFFIHCLIAAVLALGIRTSSAFSLLGPLESWQTTALGYDSLGGDLGGPKNLGEEYRWNIPTITYGYDNSFLTWFGSNGVAAVDAAFAILNRLPAMSSIDPQLRGFPLTNAFGEPTNYMDSRGANSRAEANNLVDLKSAALGLLVEELGLANPIRWTWALRDRKTLADPPITNYLVIQRNFDPVDYSPTRYVNGSRYTYRIFEFVDPAFADAIESAIDPMGEIHGPSAVAAASGGLTFEDEGLLAGVFYTDLTRDDIGGLRYLYRPDNLNWETFPAGTQIFEADTAGFQTVSNMDLTLLSLQSLTNSPGQLTNIYPGLQVRMALPRLTNQVVLEPISTQIVVNIITNRSEPLIITNDDLFTFSRFSLTNPPAVLTNAYPGLVITSTTNSITTRVDVASVYLTNAAKEPWGDPFQTNLALATNFVTNIMILYHNTYANVITNNFSPTTIVYREISGLEKEPWSDPQNPVFKTNTTTTSITVPSGGIIIIPPGTLNFEFTGVAIPRLFSLTNRLFVTNFVENQTYIRTIRDIQYTIFTNFQYAVYPIQALTQGFVTNIIVGYRTNLATYFDYQFVNVVTNYSGTSPVSMTTFVIGPDGTTNIIFGSTNLLMGGFLIDTNLTGFTFTGFQFQNLIPTSYLLSETIDGSGNRIQNFVSYIFTNTVYGILPFALQPVSGPFLRPGIDKLNFVRLGNGTIPGQPVGFTNRFQASFYTNGALVSRTFVIESQIPDILIAAADLGTFADSVFPVQSSRTASFQNNADLNSSIGGQGGPGTIEPTVVLTFNKVGPSYWNTFPGFVTEEAALRRARPFMWGSFDHSTNSPIVYPKDISLEQIEAVITGTTNP